MGKLSFDGLKFIFEPSAFADEGSLAKSAGLIWNADALRWVTRSAAKAVVLRRFADLSAELKLKNTFITELEAPECIPYPHHLKPKLFQLESAWHCLTRSPSYCADEAGLGKTITSVLCMNAVPGRVLIICPPFLKYNWADEINKWSAGNGEHQIYKPDIFIVENGDVSRDDLLGRGIIILPDSLIDSPHIQHYLKDEKFEWLFVDEAHRFGNADTKRTIALIGSEKDEKEFRKIYFYYANISKRLVFLSGTPIPNGKPVELFPILNRVVPEACEQRDLTKFGKLFCDGHQKTRYEGGRAIAHWDFNGASNLKRFRKELKKKFMIRHLKRDVLAELPPKTRKMVFLDAPYQLMPLEAKLLKRYTLEQLLGDIPTLGDIAAYQREVGLAKIAPAAEYIIDYLENNPGKLIVGAHHIEVVERLSKRLAKFGCLTIRGGMDVALKAERVRLFQIDDNDHRVLVGNIDAMGLGLTLTKASNAMVVEPSWNASKNEQFEDRIHRITQSANVYIRYLVLRGTLDERKLRSVLSKEKNINEVMG